MFSHWLIYTTSDAFHSITYVITQFNSYNDIRYIIPLSFIQFEAKQIHIFEIIFECPFVRECLAIPLKLNSLLWDYVLRINRYIRFQILWICLCARSVQSYLVIPKHRAADGSFYCTNREFNAILLLNGVFERKLTVSLIVLFLWEFQILVGTSLRCCIRDVF